LCGIVNSKNLAGKDRGGACFAYLKHGLEGLVDPNEIELHLLSFTGFDLLEDAHTLVQAR